MNRFHIITFLVALITNFSSAQTFEFISIGQGYNGQVFYSMLNGEMASITNTDWDLAFQTSGNEASVRVNGKNDVRLFRSGFPASDWSSLSPFDTINVLNSNNELFNSDTSWWYGAFNNASGLNNSLDMGWGVYDPTTQIVTGDSIFFLMTPAGNVKKVWIESLTNGVYSFRHADMDGTNEVVATLDKTNFQGKNFGYYSIASNSTIDREPLNNDWDLLFSQYMAVTPITYKVTGVLANDNVHTAKAYPVEYSNADPWAQPLTGHINNIGYDWKSFDLNTFSWVIADSTVYFVQDRAGQIWKMMFTGFGGSATGDYEFVKDPISLTSVDQPEYPQILSMYPNPSNSMVRIVLSGRQSEASVIRVQDISGKTALKRVVEFSGGLQEVDLDISHLKNGLYIVSIQGDAGVNHQKLQVLK